MRGSAFFIFLFAVLFAALEHLAHERIDARGGGDVQPLLHRMHIVQLRSHRQRVEAGDLFDEESALKAAVGGFDLPVVAGEVAVDRFDLLAEGRIAVVLPAGIVAALAHGAAAEFDDGLHALNEHILLRGDAGADGERALHAVLVRAHHAEVERSLHKTGEVGAYLSDHPLDINDLLKTLGLYDHRDKLPNQLSGGQQQRTSIGRAIIKNPSILLCDEPTGALDYHTSKEILKLIEDVNQKYGNTVIMVTHNDAIKNMADRVIRLRDGQIRKNYVNETKIAAGDLDW